MDDKLPKFHYPDSLYSAIAPSEPGPPYGRDFAITLRHTTFVRTPLDEWSARRRDLRLTVHNTDKWQTFMSSAGFEPAISKSATTTQRLNSVKYKTSRFLDITKFY